ncbi:MAG TPA: sugar phosphate isomerase/epimerase family protein [Ktedonobacteraceae bacterium]|nr:sugar phosphate isomerase/epimerase family protein [Ktedonobacteraceae bacterium]
MNTAHVTFTVFTKPWRMPLPRLGAFIKTLGFDGVELPVRPGYQVTPERVTTGLQEAVHILADCGLALASISGPTDETTIAACGELGIPVLRVCLDIPAQVPYLEHEARLQREFDALVPLLQRYGVTLGIQNHYGRFVANAMGIRHLIEKYDPRHIGAVLDFAHCALNGEIPELALDIVWSHLRMVNFKNAYWQRTNGPEAQAAAYKVYWTSGRQGLASWARVAQELKQRGYSGPICLTAEYSDEAAVDRLISEDITYARSLFE